MRLIFCFLIIFTFYSCKTSRKIVALPERTKEEVLEAINKRNIDFDWFSAKASTSIESPDENVSGTLLIRMKSDSILWVTVKKIGVEIARILANKTKYTVLYRWEKAYEEYPLRHLKSYIQTDTEFEDIQQLLFGNVIIPDAANTEFIKDSLGYVLDTKSGDLKIKYFINAYNLELDKMDITDNSGRKASVKYSDYRNVGNFGNFAFSRIYHFPLPSGDYGSVNMELSEVEINKPKDINFSIPSHYEKIN